MLIDFHTHIFPDEIAFRALKGLQENAHTALFSSGTLSGLQSSAHNADINLSVVLPVATEARQVAHINRRAILQREKEQTTHVTSFGAAHPDDPDYRSELEKVSAAGLRGIKIHPPFQGVDLDDMRFLRLLERAGELDLIVVTHAGLDIGLPGENQATPEKIRHAIKQVGPVRMVCAHMGGWRCWNQVCDLLADTPVYLDTSFSLGRITPSGDGYPWSEENLNMLSEEDFCMIIRLFGASRVVFGTDSPWNDQLASVEAINRLPLSVSEKKAILGENAAGLLGLNRQEGIGY